MWISAEVRDTTQSLWSTGVTKVLREEKLNMSMMSHLQELRKKHEALSVQVEREQRSPASDALHIADLKKQKLKIKEEITRLSMH